MIRFVAILAAFVAVLLTCLPAAAAPHIVFDYKTGRVYSHANAFDRWYPASVTKMMTAYTVFREIRKGTVSPLSPVRISSYALSKPPSKMGYPVGTIMNVDTALKIILVKSANDVATALAESVAGSEAAFIARMNGYAREIGMTNSRFTNPHGLHDERQYSTARDLALLARRIHREFPRELGYFGIPAIKVGNKLLGNHNALLHRFPGATGMKTGFICAAGLNVVVSAKVRGKNLIAVVLGGETGQARNVKAAKLLHNAANRAFSFSLPKFDRLKSPKAVKRPVDMRQAVCKRRAKPATVANGKAAATFALREPTLDELEQRYLMPKTAARRYVPIVLGNATGPDPFGLVTPNATIIAQGDGDAETINNTNALVPSAGAQNRAANAAASAIKRFVLKSGKTVAVPSPRPVVD